MPRGRLSPSYEVWLKNWRYPPVKDKSTLVSYKVVGYKNVVYDTFIDGATLMGEDAEDGEVAGESNNAVVTFLTSAATKTTALFSTTLAYLEPGGVVGDVVELDPARMAAAMSTSTTAAAHPPMAVTEDLVMGFLGNRNLTYSLVLMFISIMLVITSVLTIYVISTTDTLKDVIGHYLISLAATDLMFGLIVTPMALYASLDDSITARPVDRTLCKLEAYTEMALYATHVYAFMWIGVDRFAALRRPQRYEAEQTLTRCKCWIVFTWITAALLCCPTLFDEMHSRYHRQTFICVLDWARMAPYTVTLVVLVLAPSFLTVTYSYVYIVRKLYDPSDLDETQRNMLENDSSYVMTFFVVLFHFVSWTPWFGLKVYEYAVLKHELASRPLHFSLLWLAIGGAIWKIFIYTSLNVEFRNRLRTVLTNATKCPRCWWWVCSSWRRCTNKTSHEDMDYVPTFEYMNGKGERI